MSDRDNWQTYANDSRTICKYGARCYQKNPEHHKTYKHPPSVTKKNTTIKRATRKYSPYKRIDLENVKAKADEDQVKNDETIVEQVNADDDSCSDNSVVKIPESFEYYDKNPDHNLYKEMFLVDMPEDFYKLYECLNKDGNQIEKLLLSVNLELIGPYDLLLGKLPVLTDKELYLVHWRFFYDPPEFQAVMKRKGTSEFHMGYYRDSPNETPVFLASNDSSKDCRITPIANNIFAAVYLYLENEKKTSPFVSMACQRIMDKIKKAAEQNNFSLNKYDIKQRRAQIVAKTLHGAGIVVPYNRKTQLGYRNLIETDANLEKLFAKLKEAETQESKDNALSELQPVITYANIAVDECDFGTGLEAGIDLFCSGLKDLEPSALACLTSAYNLLNREPFSRIIKAHLKYRRIGSKLSILDFK